MGDLLNLKHKNKSDMYTGEIFFLFFILLYMYTCRLVARFNSSVFSFRLYGKFGCLVTHS